MVSLQRRSKYRAKSLLGHDFVIMSNDAADGNFPGKPLRALAAFWWTPQCQ